MPENIDLPSTSSAPLQAVSMLEIIARIRLISMSRICIRLQNVPPCGGNFSVLRGEDGGNVAGRLQLMKISDFFS